MALIINQVKKKYGKIEALQGVSMALKAGEDVALNIDFGECKYTAWIWFH